MNSRNKEASGAGMDEPAELWEMRAEGEMGLRSFEALEVPSGWEATGGVLSETFI